MPFTPLHMGPGLAIKALAGRHFSILSFGIAQVAMDIEPLLGLIRGARVLHGPTHTYLAAFVIALAVAVLAPPICRPIVRFWNTTLSPHHARWRVAPESLTRIPVMVGAFSGTFSHVLLDSFMHADITPLAPWSDTNALLGVIPIGTLHELCLLAGVLGTIGWFLMASRCPSEMAVKTAKARIHRRSDPQLPSHRTDLPSKEET